MKTIMIFFMICILAAPDFADETIGAVSIGMNNYLGSSSEFPEISSQGPGIGLLVPVSFPKRPVHLKLKASFHNVTESENMNSSFILISNEILLGQRWLKAGRMDVLPQIGLGFLGERYKIEKGNGRSHGDIFFDLSFRFDFDLDALNIGALVNFERDFNLGYGSLISPNRLNVALVLSK